MLVHEKETFLILFYFTEKFANHEHLHGGVHLIDSIPFTVFYKIDRKRIIEYVTELFHQKNA